VEVWSDRQGTILYTGNYIEAIQSRLTDVYKHALFVEAKRTETPAIQRFFDTGVTRNQQESMLYYTYIDGDGGRLLMVSANISPVSATVETLRIQLVYISGIMLLLAVGLAILITRRVARPIARLSDAARRMGSGETDVAFRADGKSYREIAELADTLERAREELARTEQLRQELIANVSHDLRTPLTLITGYGEMIRDLPDENTPENMQVIIDESKRLTSLVSDLLDLSRLQSGTGRMEFTRFNLTEDTKNIIGRFAKLCEQEGFTILFERDEDVWVTADPERIAQVTYNFLINAITHTGDDKNIIVRQITGNGRVIIRVEDNGEGIPPENLASIWDRYYKADEVHKRAQKGSGLGLSIVKSILEQHPGVEYGVESTLGVGSAFWFSLPI
jgi:signal transduction histidine kinase